VSCDGPSNSGLRTMRSSGVLVNSYSCHSWEGQRKIVRGKDDLESNLANSEKGQLPGGGKVL